MLEDISIKLSAIDSQFPYLKLPLPLSLAVLSLADPSPAEFLNWTVRIAEQHVEVKQRTRSLSHYLHQLLHLRRC